MTIGTMDQLLAGFANPNRQRIPFVQTGSGSVSASTYFSYWRLNGVNKQLGARPTVATVCDITTVGGIPYSSADAVSQNLYIGRVSAMSTTILEMTIADRLIHHGNVTMSTTTAQTVSISLPASADQSNLKNRIGAANYSEVQWRFESWNGVTAVGGAITFSYTNHLGVSGLTATATVPGAMSSYQSHIITPQPGDFIRSIETVNTNAVASGASGVGMIVAYNERFSTALPAINNMVVADWETVGLARIYDNSCLCINTCVGGTSPGTISGMITLIQG